MKITEYLKESFIFFDGGMGTLLQSAGLPSGVLPERWSVTYPQTIVDIHRSYLAAGSNVITANTFGANCLKFSEEELDAVIGAAISCARKAERESRVAQPTWVALDVGPTGKLLAPLGSLDFEDAVEIFAKTIRLGVKHGADLILIETMNDSYETKAALLAAKENSSLPVFVTNAYGEDGKLMTGADPLAMIALLEGMGADAIGVNCSQGPKGLMGVVDQYLKYSSLPIIVQPNAGLPRANDGKTFFDVSSEEFASDVCEMLRMGVRVAGGCCGTTPEYIAALTKGAEGLKPMPVKEKDISLVSSYTHAVVFGKSPVLIGERINPTGKKLFKEALRRGDMDYILKEGLGQEEAGAQILDVNVGLPEIDEPSMLTAVVKELQTVTALPLQIDTSDPYAMEKALRVYNGKAMINSVSGKAESMAAVFPLVKKYGGVCVALTLDESGIPDTAEGRARIAERILAEAQKYGISKKDIIFDPLAMTVSADSRAARVTLDSLDIIKHRLGGLTSLGVSNVSFGLPSREVITGVFFAMALERGLSAAIMNPYSSEMMKVYHSYRALSGLDENCGEYIEFASSFTESPTVSDLKRSHGIANTSYGSELQAAIVKGMKQQAAALTRSFITEGGSPMDAVNGHIIPALNIVGEGFDKKTVFLPGLLMSAEAAGRAFEVVKEFTPKGDTKKAIVVLATVKGDIHDIGKNIVKLLLENYGYDVRDLGRDVPPQAIVDEVLRLGAPIVGLSALMTTTVPAMEETIKLLRRDAPFCKVVVGGAVLTASYAASIGADAYAADAMEAVRVVNGFGS